MRRLTVIAFPMISILLSGCGRGAIGTSPFSGTPSSPANSVPDIAGNWQFNMTPSAQGAQPASIAGSVSQNGAQVTGAFHVGGSNCFNRLTVRSLTGTVSSNTTTLTSTAADGQTITITGQFTKSASTGTNSFAGTYSVSGGCDAGDQGSVAGNSVPDIANNVSGVFTNSAQQSFDMSGGIAQNASADPTGSFGISGTAAFATPCFNAATVQAGAFPSGSYILGMSVGLEFDAGSGIVTFSGTLNQDRNEIVGNYTISGGACDGATGTAVLQVTSPWDY